MRRARQLRQNVCGPVSEFLCFGLGCHCEILNFYRVSRRHERRVLLNFYFGIVVFFIFLFNDLLQLSIQGTHHRRPHGRLLSFPGFLGWTFGCKFLVYILNFDNFRLLFILSHFPCAFDRFFFGVLLGLFHGFDFDKRRLRILLGFNATLADINRV